MTALTSCQVVEVNPLAVSSRGSPSGLQALAQRPPLSIGMSHGENKSGSRAGAGEPEVLGHPDERVRDDVSDLVLC